MITTSEAGLTTDQWNALKVAKTDAVYQVIAHRWLPEFTVDHVTTVVNAGDDFASVIHSSKLYRIAHDVVEYYDTLWHTVSGFSLPDGMTSTPYSLISDTDLYVFALTTSGIAVRTYDGSSWSDWSIIVSDSTITSMSAVASNRVHYVVRDSTNNRYNLKVAQYSGSWSVLASEVYWPYPIFSFSAVTLNGKDVLAISTEVPGALSAKFINNQIVKYTLRSGGLFGFTFQYDSWSDHFAIENLDQLTQWVYRNNVRLSVINNKIWLSCYSSIGDEVSALTFYRVFCSKDGLHWSRGEYFPVNQDEHNGFNLTLLGDELYAIFRTVTQKAVSTLMFDHSPSSQQLDISSEILSLRIDRQDMQQIDVVVDNSTHWVEDSIVDGTTEVMLIVNLGYKIAGEDVLLQTGIFEVDAVTPSQDLPTTQIEITGRDWLAWMSGKTQAETFRYWEPQTTYGDEYEDTTGTGYGGMTNTAIQTGSWSTSAFTLRLEDNESEGIVYNVILSDDTTWNGMIETAFVLSKVPDTAYAGLMFRAQDKDNAFFFFYKQSDDKLHLTQRVGGSSTDLWTSSSTKSWATTRVHRWLRVDFYYCRLRLYSSSDGITWTLDGNVLVKGKPLGTSSSPDGMIQDTDAFPQSGFVGLIGKGFSDETGWTGDPGVFPPAIFQEPFYYILPGALTTPFKFWTFGDETGDPGHVGKLQLATDGTGDWTDVDMGISSLNAVTALSNPFNVNEKWLAFDKAIYKSTIWDSSPTFTLVAHAIDIWTTASNPVIDNIVMTPGLARFIWVTGHDGLSNALTAWSFDYGVTWTFSFIFAASALITTIPGRISGWDGVIYTVYQGRYLFKSADFGQTWNLVYSDPTLHTGPPAVGTFPFVDMVVPYRRDDGSPNLNGLLVYATRQDNAAHDVDGHTHCCWFRSDDGGIHWTKISDIPFWITSNSSPSSNLYVHPTNSKIIKYAGGKYLITSEDGGITWTMTDTGSSHSWALINGWPYSTTFAVLANRGAANDGIYTEEGTSFTSISEPDHANMVPPTMIEAELGTDS